MTAHNHFPIFGSHLHLIALDPPGPVRRWRCFNCDTEGTDVDQMMMDDECPVPARICEWCFFAPECSIDCVGIGLALSSDAILVVDGR